MVRNSDLKSLGEVGREVAKNNEGWRLTFASHNYIHFKVDVEHSVRYIDAVEDMSVFDACNVQQWKDKASEINVAIHR